ncbi:adenine phosphoribosyltransferase [Alphaproteobacteria bacterium]|jgi:adenine phosphoribosyltransferase|nr:adenine phosphoribosyltransferase [Alphaproteobacteria bacterium]
MNLKSLIRTVPNYPKPGILFRDISTLLYNGNALKYITEIYYNRYKDISLNGIAAIEARGFIFGAILAEKLGISFIPIRKKGKLPCKVFSEEYQLEYGTDILEVDITAIKKNDNILVIDDLIATGGTAIATGNLINKFSANIHEYTFLINLPDLGGAKKLIDSNYNVYSLMEFPGE